MSGTSFTAADFTRTARGWRFVQTRVGDTLQAIALRTMGDAARWPELVWLNGLVPPYLTDDPAGGSAGVIAAGGTLKVLAPAASGVATTAPADNAANDAQVFGAGFRLTNGQLTASGGAFSLVAGRDNLRQALQIRLGTALGELIFHPRYGCDARRLIGAVNGPTKRLFGAAAVRRALAADSRIRRVASSTAAAVGDAVVISAVAEPVVGQPVAMQVSV
jgi:phage baseplate assembly protein W